MTLLINTAADLASTAGPEQQAFLQSLLNDVIAFDDAVYPDGYDRALVDGDTGYVAPVARLEWNAGAAAGWGFDSREAIEAALA